MLKKLICALVCLCLISCVACAMERDEMRALWREMEESMGEGSPYLAVPDAEKFSPGALTQAAQASALSCLNFLRALAGLDSVKINELYTLRAQHGALLLAANDVLDHHPEKPANMNEEIYETGLLGTSLGNIAKFNWMRPEILIDGVRYFARDDGDFNLPVMGHRRWLLNPLMAETGFGLANAKSGMSYVCMYAVDTGNASAQWDYVPWPASGYFPVELMRRELAWSVSLNEEIYDASASKPRILLREAVSGAEFHFDTVSGAGDGYSTFSRDACGSGPCLIFRPNISDAGLEEYLQNQRWTVEIDGLVGVNGEELTINYTSDMVSLYPQEVANLEISPLAAELSVGESLQMRVGVVPAYADDLSVIWSCSDDNIALVDAEGLLTARAPGNCTITVQSANGKYDTCEVTVLDK